MSEYLSDQEQADRVIKFVKKHGYNILIAIMLALTAYFGYQYFQNKKLHDNAVASSEFQNIRQSKQKLMLAQMQDKPVTKAQNTEFLSGVDNLVKAHPDSIYAQQALMLKAQYYVEQNKLDKAHGALVQAKAVFTKDKNMLNVIDMRIAKVLTAQNKADEAIKLLNKNTNAAFAATKQELLGDAYLVLKQTDKAKAAYKAAWQAGIKDKDVSQVLKLKMEQLGLEPSLKANDEKTNDEKVDDTSGNKADNKSDNKSDNKASNSNSAATAKSTATATASATEATTETATENKSEKAAPKSNNGGN